MKMYVRWVLLSFFFTNSSFAAAASHTEVDLHLTPQGQLCIDYYKKIGRQGYRMGKLIESSYTVLGFRTPPKKVDKKKKHAYTRVKHYYDKTIQKYPDSPFSVKEFSENVIKANEAGLLCSAHVFQIQSDLDGKIGSFEFDNTGHKKFRMFLTAIPTEDIEKFRKEFDKKRLAIEKRNKENQTLFASWHQS